jgi:hypothetical protein
MGVGGCHSVRVAFSLALPERSDEETTSRKVVSCSRDQRVFERFRSEEDAPRKCRNDLQLFRIPRTCVGISPPGSSSRRGPRRSSISSRAEIIHFHLEPNRPSTWASMPSPRRRSASGGWMSSTGKSNGVAYDRQFSTTSRSASSPASEPRFEPLFRGLRDTSIATMLRQSFHSHVSITDAPQRHGVP